MIFAALAMAIIVACNVEVASQFSEAGGGYLYTRTAFGRFVGMQIGWFFLLAGVGTVAVAATLFMTLEPQFAAFVSIDWADKKHLWCLQAAGKEKRESGELEHTPEAVEAWVGQLYYSHGL